MKNLLAAAAAILLCFPAGAIELSLEENRAQRGSIGYIDMQRLFKTFPETLRAKENFEELVRQAEEQLNLRKAEILRLRNDLAQLKIQREFMAQTPIEVQQVQPQKAPEPVRAPQPAPAPAPAPAPRDLSALPGFSTAGSTAAAQPEALAINIPGVSTAPIVVQPPQDPKAAEQAALAASEPPGALVGVATGTVPAAPAPAANPALVELDAKIVLKAQQLADKEREHKDQQAAAEKNLLDIESRKTEILLGKIHKTVQEVAREEGVSVVVDKGSILYGHDAVDLTDKVMKRLKGQ